MGILRIGMHLFTLFMEVILIRILEIGMHLFTLFLELKTEQDQNIKDRDSSLHSFHGRIRILGIGMHLLPLLMGVKN
jgi:hypothetical protein